MSECKSRHPFSTAMLLLLFVLETTCSIATGIGKKLAFSKVSTDFSQCYTFFQNWSWMTTTSTDGPSLALFFYLWSLQLLENYWEVAFIVDVVERLAQVGYPWYFTISTQHSCKLQKCVGFFFLFGNLVIFFCEINIINVNVVFTKYLPKNNEMHSAVWKLRKFTITHFWQKFREINVFSKEVTKELIWRKKILVRENFA